MNINQLSLTTSQNSVVNAFSTKMLANSMDIAKAEGAMLAESIASAPSPSLESLVYPTMGKNIDTTV